MRVLLMVGCILSLTACASSPNAGGELSTGTRMTTQTVVAGPGGGAVAVNMVNEASAVGSAVNGTVDEAWSALQSVYVSLEIPQTFRDDVRKSLGTTSFRTRRRIGPVPMIRIVDCGGESGMPNAETYDVTLQISSLVTPGEGGKARLQTLVQGTARRPSSGAVNDARCTSIGGLEERISEMVNAILAGKGV